MILLKWAEDLSLHSQKSGTSAWIFLYTKWLPTYLLEAATPRSHLQQWNKIPEIFVAQANNIFYNSYATGTSLLKGHVLLDSHHVLLKSLWALPLAEWALDHVLTAEIFLQRYTRSGKEEQWHPVVICFFFSKYVLLKYFFLSFLSRWPI